MSRFFATGTDSESESSSEDEPVVRAPAPVYTVSINHMVLIVVPSLLAIARIANSYYISRSPAWLAQVYATFVRQFRKSL